MSYEQWEVHIETKEEKCLTGGSEYSVDDTKILIYSTSKSQNGILSK